MEGTVTGAGGDSGLPGLLGGGGGGGGVVEEVEEDGALALGALGIVLGEHDVHEAAWTAGEHHGRPLGAVCLRRQAGAGGGRPTRGVVAAAGGSHPSRGVPSRRQRQVQLQVQLLALPVAAAALAHPPPPL
ncbi:hypothetical protein GW17_00011379 [Ensete ventricosum]|nr:hypothetical protein GW17_00011379 [Ensete ventricosum]RZR89584.1 hypothetical protein BHM03_00017342 [Ensete ventricosum]